MTVLSVNEEGCLMSMVGLFNKGRIVRVDPRRGNACVASVACQCLCLDKRRAWVTIASSCFRDGPDGRRGFPLLQGGGRDNGNVGVGDEYRG